VAGFIGSPRMNFVTGTYASEKGADTVGIRPEHILVGGEGGELSGTVGVAEHLGSDTFMNVEVAGLGTLRVRANGEVGLNYGDTTKLTIPPARLHRFDANGQAI
ncbi:MAG: TOBE domain-containing protein, partial [Pseudomonadota bacterium]